jgi:hypothetical protein
MGPIPGLKCDGRHTFQRPPLDLQSPAIACPAVGRKNSIRIPLGHKNSIRIPRTALSEAELYQAALPLYAFHRELAPGLAGDGPLDALTMVEPGLLSFSNCLFRAIRWVPPAYCRRSPRFHLID